MSDRPIRIQRSRRRGWRTPLGAIYVGRPTAFGNPFTIADILQAGYAKDDATAQRLVVECFSNWVSGSDKWWTGPTSEAARRKLLECLPTLRGKHLVCWCRIDQPCHADILLEIANR